MDYLISGLVVIFLKRNTGRKLHCSFQLFCMSKYFIKVTIYRSVIYFALYEKAQILFTFRLFVRPSCLLVILEYNQSPDCGCLHMYITKTCLYNFDPLKPHFYIEKLGFTGVYIIFLFSAQKIDCGYSLEPPRRGGSNEYLQSMFWAEIWKILEFYIWKLSFFGGKHFSIFE